MKSIVVILLFVILLGGGGVGAYLFMQKTAIASTDEESVEVEKEEIDYTMEFVEMDPIVLPVLTKRGVKQIVSLIIVLEVENVEAKDKVKRLSPRIKDAYISEMYGSLHDKTAFRDGVLNVKLIKKRLNAISKKVVGDDLIKDVLLQVVRQKRL